MSKMPTAAASKVDNYNKSVNNLNLNKGNRAYSAAIGRHFSKKNLFSRRNIIESAKTN